MPRIKKVNVMDRDLRKATIGKPSRKKRLVVIEDPRDEEDESLDIPLSKEEEGQILEEEQAQEWLSEFQSRFSDQPVRILVEKYDDAGDWGMCHKYPLHGFEQESVKAEFGGGKYRGSLVGPDGRFIKGGRIHFKFAESLSHLVNAPKTDNPLDNPMVLMMIKSMEAQQNQMLELAKSMITAQTSTPKSGGLVELIEAMKSLKTMTPTDSKPIDNFKETLGIMKLVKEVTGDGDGDGKGGILSDLKDVLEVLPQLKEQMAALKPPALPVPAQTVVIPTAHEKEVPMGTMDPLSQKIIDLVPKFVGAAKASAPVPQWGAYLLDMFDTEILPVLLPVLQAKYKALVKDEDDVYDIVLRLGKDAGERENVFKQIPPLAPYRPWVNAVIDHAIMLAESPEVEENAPQEAVITGGSAILSHVNGTPSGGNKSSADPSLSAE